MKSGRVTRDYQSAYPDPLIVRKGEVLTIIPKESEWAGWVWCINDSGKGAWVPESYIARVGDSCKALYDYSSNELNIRKGELMTVIKEESGWVWCENENGERGWAPLENIEIATE